MRPPVDGDDASGMDHFVVHHHVVVRLDDLDVLVVADRHHRRSGVVPEQAPFRGVSIFGTIGQPPQARAALVRAPLSLRKKRWQPPVCRIGDERGAPVADDLCTELVPEFVVAA